MNEYQKFLNKIAFSFNFTYPGTFEKTLMCVFIHTEYYVITFIDYIIMWTYSGGFRSEMNSLGWQARPEKPGYLEYNEYLNECTEGTIAI